MEIIKRGTKTLPEDKIYIGKCHTCGCKFTYNECDTTFSRITDYKVVKCPQCKWCKGVGLVDSQGNLFAIERSDSNE